MQRNFVENCFAKLVVDMENGKKGVNWGIMKGKGEKGQWKRVESAGTPVRGVNVRRDERARDVWHAAGVPKAVRGDSWRPLQRMVLPEVGCEVVMMRSGNLLGVIAGRPGATAAADEDALEIL